MTKPSLSSMIATRILISRIMTDPALQAYASKFYWSIENNLCSARMEMHDTMHVTDVVLFSRFMANQRHLTSTADDMVENIRVEEVKTGLKRDSRRQNGKAPTPPVSHCTWKTYVHQSIMVMDACYRQHVALLTRIGLFSPQCQHPVRHQNLQFPLLHPPSLQHRCAPTGQTCVHLVLKVVIFLLSKFQYISSMIYV